MKKILPLCFLIYLSTITNATVRDSTIVYNLPDSVKAVQFMAEVQLKNLSNTKHFRASISGGIGSILFDERKGRRRIIFAMHEFSRMLSIGYDVRDIGIGAMAFNYRWEEGKTYKILISIASDSALQVCLASGYIFLPDEKKWKFIGCRRHPFPSENTIRPSVFIRANKKSRGEILMGQAWVQRQDGSWKYMKEGNPAAPIINYYGHADSVAQREKDIKIITDSISAGKTDAITKVNDVYYTMLKEGTGRQVSVDDTVTVFYKGYLFSNATIFDQTKEKPATFPLKRLIKGWQIGLQQCKVGGKIKLLIPSDLAYSIRTRSAKIPPNSILVFEIEVMDAK